MRKLERLLKQFICLTIVISVYYFINGVFHKSDYLNDLKILDNENQNLILNSKVIFIISNL